MTEGQSGRDRADERIPWLWETPEAEESAGPDQDPESQWRQHQQAQGDSGSAGSDGGRPTASWGDRVGPPSLRRPAPAPKAARRLPGLVLPVAAALGVLVVVAIVLVFVLGGGDEPTGTPTTPTAPPPTSPTASYSPPPGAIVVGNGASVVPLQGWTLFAAEKNGRQLIAKDPTAGFRAFFWVRQRVGISAREYVVRIVEGEAQKGTNVRMATTRNLTCPRDVLVECVQLGYTMTVRDAAGRSAVVRGWTEAYRRKDGVVTAIDFQTRPDFATKAYADAQVMKKSVVDSL